MKKILSIFIVFAALLSMQLFYDGQRELKTLAVEMGDGQDIQCCTCGDSFYYIIFERDTDPTVFLFYSAIFYEQKAHGKPCELFRLDTPDGCWINEFRATDKYLFWVYTDQNRTAIEGLRLDSKKHTEIVECPLGRLPLMNSNNRYLTWKSSESRAVCVLDTCDMSITEIPDSAAFTNFYTRVIPSEDSLLAYIVESDGMKKMMIYDLNTREKRTVEIGQWPVYDPDVNGDWLIFTDNVEPINKTIYALNLHNDHVQSYSAVNGLEPYTFYLYKDNIVVSSKRKNEVEIINLLHGTIKKMDAGGWLVTTSVNEDGLFCGLDKEGQCLRYLHLD